ncbi:DNA repair protein RecO [candidate division WWE3 bacterium CG10_big_fil_rev_8_21_14_0_10_48_23]|uniref:DNA repair protein RecO n=1 Tax=candidate division WWE3 bacterium CG_4_9_14_0_2_um_filter_48_10 TaxID=1975078 RepID=A0A2M8EKG6_UNCKA|nr:MAG: DNA repair protein RecO [candidate division WWE3 bacterium CG_4_10_14_0_2_um_filter_47_8]PJC23219.1 MAG: DNA repair protein RecO [candidate division WWE3 bacterium CG_4_9_14_0_2_um_filter_48_10]PJE50633.1 MAG: DNA repair protein RecO [candidate division WWE3 bacterium CG10_big_fil_rev_8_21_14_0_10_48_23]
MPTYRDEGIVIRKQNFSEADKIVTLYTRDNGRVTAIAKGARKLISRKVSTTELFVHGIYYLAKGRDMDIVVESETLNAFTLLREDLQKAALAFYLTELLDSFTKGGQANYPLYRLFLETMSILSRAKTKHNLWIRAFEMKALNHLGFGPELFQCASCTSPLSAEKYFEVGHGGTVCRECFREGILLREPLLIFLRDLQRLNWNELSRLRFEEQELTDSEKVIQHYLRHVLEKDLFSLNFIEKVREQLEIR